MDIFDLIGDLISVNNVDIRELNIPNLERNIVTTKPSQVMA